MNRIVIITGGTAGLGLSLAEKFVEAGDTVYAISRTKRRWISSRKRIGDVKHFFLHQVDVTSEGQVKKLISKIFKKSKKIDILINNAGYANLPARVEDQSRVELQRNLAQNLVSAFLVCKATIPIFRKQKKGVIINISSMAGKRAVPRLSAYSASKFGIVALSQAIAKENADMELKCFTVCPGGMNTEMRSKLFGREDAERQQTPEFVADKIMEVLEGEIEVESGGDIVIRHGQITAIDPCPGA